MNLGLLVGRVNCGMWYVVYFITLAIVRFYTRLLLVMSNGLF
jgi:hypothetical protein